MRVRKGEHILPQAIGGALTIKEISGLLVCHTCNNGVLSQIDKELCGRSFLSVVASQELGANIYQAWDVDHTADNLLIEAKPVWKDGDPLSLVAYPQIIFEPGGPQFRGDGEEIERFGREDYLKVLAKAANNAFKRHAAGEKRVLHFESVQSNIEQRGYRLSPRLFTNHSIFEIAENIRSQSFILHYRSANDVRRAFQVLSRLDNPPKFDRWAQKLGSPISAMFSYFELGAATRALMKIGINILAAYCEKTTVNVRSFPIAIRLIMGCFQIDQSVFEKNGFVHSTDLYDLGAIAGSHTFRMVYLNNTWKMYSSFFGGRIRAVVDVLGPNKEDWNTLDIVAPIKGKAWRVTKSPLVQPIRDYHIEWHDVHKIAPSLRLHGSASSLRVEKTLPVNGQPIIRQTRNSQPT